MRDIPTKVDDIGDTLDSGEFNSDQIELENVITTTYQTLDNASGPDNDLYMLSKAIATYATASNMYQDNGSVNTYVLSRTTTLKTVDAYVDGMRIFFKASYSNTGASTINVSGLGVKSIKNVDGSNLLIGQIPDSEYTQLVYRSSSDRFEILGFGGAASEFAGGTIMVFGNSSAPTGWVRKTDWADNAMFCYSSSGSPLNGGTANPQDTHTHTGPSHSHTGPSHSHTGPSHYHSTAGHTLSINEMPAHTHSTDPRVNDGSGNYIADSNGGGGTHSRATGWTGGGASHSHGNTGNSGTGNTSSDGTGNTSSDGTGNTSENTAPLFQELIAAYKS